MNNNVTPWYYSWPVIIIAFIVFWPVGLILLILRNTGNKQSVFLGSTDKKKYVIAGIVLIVLAITSFSKSNGTMGVIYLAGGIALIAYANVLVRKSQRNRQYIDLIVNNNETSLDKIASVCNVQYDTAVKELKSLITFNVLKNATINEADRTITMVQQQPQQQTVTQFVNDVAAGFTGASEQAAPVSCTCPGCGAKVVVRPGQTVVCEYCDTPITAN